MTNEDREQSLFEIYRNIMCLDTHDDLDEVVRSITMRRNDLSREAEREKRKWMR